jgi:hypothetical protein
MIFKLFKCWTQSLYNIVCRLLQTKNGWEIQEYWTVKAELYLDRYVQNKKKDCKSRWGLEQIKYELEKYFGVIGYKDKIASVKTCKN